MKILKKKSVKIVIMKILKLNKCTYVLIILGVLLISILVFAAQLLYYILSEFIWVTHPGIQCPKCVEVRKNEKIPKHIHQVFFSVDGSPMPQRYVENQKSWKEKHPGFEYTIWNISMVGELIDKEYKHIKKLYYSYGHWIRRIDVAKYLVLHHAGGVYFDMDLKCKKPVTGLLEEINYTGILMYTTWPMGVSNDIVFAEKQHPFMEFVINSLEYANRYYFFPHAQTMLSTGPTFLSGRWFNFKVQDDFHIYPPSIINQYVERTAAYSWHGWDSATIKWIFFDNIWWVKPTVKCLVLTIVVFLGIFIYKRKLRLWFWKNGSNGDV